MLVLQWHHVLSDFEGVFNLLCCHLFGDTNRTILGYQVAKALADDSTTSGVGNAATAAATTVSVSTALAEQQEKNQQPQPVPAQGITAQLLNAASGAGSRACHALAARRCGELADLVL